MRFWLLSGLLACGAPPALSPTLDVEQDALLATLPADVSLVAGGDVAALVASPLARRLAGRGLFDPDALDAQAAALGVGGWTAVRAGCGGAGCVAVGPATLDRGALESAAMLEGLAVDDDGQRAILSAGGVPFAAETRGEILLAGDLPAVAAFGGPGIDRSAFRGAIPAGDAWIGARDADRFLAQAADRLDAEGSRRARRLAAKLRDPRRTAKARLARTIGLAVSAGEAPSAVLRVVCVDTMAAREVEWMIAFALATMPTLESAEVVRVGAVVEARMAGTADEWLAMLEGSR